MEILESFCTIGGNVKSCFHYGNSMVFTQKSKIELPCDSAIPLRIYPKELKVEFWRDICISMTKAALFTIVKTWKQPKCPSTDKWMSKMQYTHTVKHYSDLKRKKILIYAITWMKLEDIMLNKLSHSQKDNIHDSIYMRYLELKLQRDKVE